jgi:hypothetical protein
MTVLRVLQSPSKSSYMLLDCLARSIARLAHTSRGVGDRGRDTHPGVGMHPSCLLSVVFRASSAPHCPLVWPLIHVKAVTTASKMLACSARAQTNGASHHADTFFDSERAKK